PGRRVHVERARDGLALSVHVIEGPLDDHEDDALRLRELRRLRRSERRDQQGAQEQCAHSHSSTMEPRMGPRIPSSSFFSAAGTLNLSSVATRCPTSASNCSPVMCMPACAVFMSRPEYT